jgi:DNA-binding transcriptional regulator LsrR (DeoR family)
VPQESVSMRKVKEVLRLRFGLGLQQNQIARSCSIGQATVSSLSTESRRRGFDLGRFPRIQMIAG